jgi:hypothetical protein
VEQIQWRAASDHTPVWSLWTIVGPAPPASPREDSESTLERRVTWETGSFPVPIHPCAAMHVPASSWHMWEELSAHSTPCSFTPVARRHVSLETMLWSHCSKAQGHLCPQQSSDQPSSLTASQKHDSEETRECSLEYFWIGITHRVLPWHWSLDTGVSPWPYDTEWGQYSTRCQEGAGTGDKNADSQHGLPGEAHEGEMLPYPGVAVGKKPAIPQL